MLKGIKKILKHYGSLFKDAIGDLKTKGKRHKQIPNLLTLSRLIAAPCFIIPAALIGSVPLIVLFTVVFSLTDALDGFIARKYHLTSELGRDLDAICDKVFAGTLLIAASCFNPILLVNLLGETVIAAVNIKQKIEGHVPKSLYVGKIKTCVLYPLLGAGILNNFININGLLSVLLAATTTMQMLTITSYLLKYEVKLSEDSIRKEKELEEVEIEDNNEEEKTKENVLQKEIDKEVVELANMLQYETNTYNEEEKAKVKVKVYKK